MIGTDDSNRKHKLVDSSKTNEEFSKESTGKDESNVAFSSQHVKGDSLEDTVIEWTKQLEGINET